MMTEPVAPVPRGAHPMGWPDVEMPGYPRAPRQDGLHWLQEPGQALRPVRWIAAIEDWAEVAPGLPHASPYYLAFKGWRYVGPVEMPRLVPDSEAAPELEAASA